MKPILHISIFIVFLFFTISCNSDVPEDSEEMKTREQVKAPENEEKAATEKPKNTPSKENAVAKKEVVVPPKQLESKPTAQVTKPKKEQLKPKEVKPVVKKQKPVAKKPIAKKPIITFDEKVHQFGELEEGEKYDHKFNFKNTGNSALVIESAIPSCGCTIPSYPFIPIAPGETGYIGITYNSVGKSGHQTPDIKITTNANPKTYTLTLEGDVLEKERE